MNDRLTNGQVLADQYRVDGFLAMGGMSTVYKVWDLRRQVPLALKILNVDLTEDPVFFKRFQREANALRKLQHPNIISFYGFYREGNITFLVEAYIDGLTLREVIKEKGRKPLSISEALPIIKGICAALGYAHVNGVLHLDIKPGNIFLDKFGHIFLADFGISQIATPSNTFSEAGTPAYMSPEQIRGSNVTPATDIYAVGLMAYEILTGARPFKTKEYIVGERIILDPSEEINHIPDGLSAVLKKALAWNPSERYQNIQDFFNDVCSAVQIKPETIPDVISVNFKENIALDISSQEESAEHDLRPNKVALYLDAFIYWIKSLFSISPSPSKRKQQPPHNLPLDWGDDSTQSSLPRITTHRVSIQGAWLVSQDGKSYQLQDPETVIGRGSNNDIQILNDSSVSRQHCRISYLNGRFRLIDLGSSYGTYVNGHAVRDPIILEKGDVIQLGNRSILNFVSSLDQLEVTKLWDQLSSQLE